MNTETIRIEDATYGRPFRNSNRTNYVYGPQTWLVQVSYDDGDRFLTVADNEVLSAWGISR